MKTKLTFAFMAFLTSTAFAEFKAPLPEFKNEKQLAEWRAEKSSEATSQSYAVEETAFYTGKPYLASSGGYAFRFRSYNPELARWTSEDPSGFPDGANGSIYSAKPNSQVDYQGLQNITINGTSLGNLGSFTEAQVKVTNGISSTTHVPGSTWSNPWNAPANATITWSLSGNFVSNATIAGTGFVGTVAGTTTGSFQVAPGQKISLDCIWNTSWTGILPTIQHQEWKPVYTALPE